LSDVGKPVTASLVTAKESDIGDFGVFRKNQYPQDDVGIAAIDCVVYDIHECCGVRSNRAN